MGKQSNGDPARRLQSPCAQATSPGPQEIQHQAQQLRALLILTSQLIKGGLGNRDYHGQSLWKEPG